MTSNLQFQHVPSSHYVTVAAKHLCQAADDDVGVRQHVDVQEVADRLVDDNEEVVLICEGADAF